MRFCELDVPCFWPLDSPQQLVYPQGLERKRQRAEKHRLRKNIVTKPVGIKARGPRIVQGPPVEAHLTPLPPKRLRRMCGGRRIWPTQQRPTLKRLVIMPPYTLNPRSISKYTSLSSDQCRQSQRKTIRTRTPRRRLAGPCWYV